MPLTHETVRQELDSARTRQQLIDASQLIQFVLNVHERASLDVMVNERMALMSDGGDGPLQCRVSRQKG